MAVSKSLRYGCRAGESHISLREERALDLFSLLSDITVGKGSAEVEEDEPDVGVVMGLAEEEEEEVVPGGLELDGDM